jgi:hypothetical protein
MSRTSAGPGAKRAAPRTAGLVVSRIEVPKLKNRGSAQGNFAADITTTMLAGLGERQRQLGSTRRHVLVVADLEGETALPARPLTDTDIARLDFGIEQLVASSEPLPITLSDITLRLQFESGSSKHDKPSISTAVERVRGGVERAKGRLAQEIRETISKKLDELPVRFDVRRAELHTVHDAAREAIARAFEPALNEKARSLPQATYDDKKHVASWVNEQARELGLAVRCPRTGKPGLLRADTAGVPGVGRFAVETTDASGRRRRVFTSVALPALELVPADLSRGAYGERTDRTR